MLPKAARLPHTLFADRPLKRLKFRYGSVSLYPKPQRAAVIVSKKIAKSSVTRNTIRRRVLHALRPLMSRLDVAVLVYPLVSAEKAPLTDIQKALEEVLLPR